MPVPKKKTTISRRNKRRAHDALSPINLTNCQNPACGEKILPHKVCPFCGHYKGKMAVEVKVKK